MTGRMLEDVVSSAEEGVFLEAQVRRHKAVCSLSDPCRVILFCADGLQNKEVTNELGIYERTVVTRLARRAVVGGLGLGLGHAVHLTAWIRDVNSLR